MKSEPKRKTKVETSSCAGYSFSVCIKKSICVNEDKFRARGEAWNFSEELGGWSNHQLGDLVIIDAKGHSGEAQNGSLLLRSL